MALTKPSKAIIDMLSKPYDCHPSVSKLLSQKQDWLVENGHCLRSDLVKLGPWHQISAELVIRDLLHKLESERVNAEFSVSSPASQDRTIMISGSKLEVNFLRRIAGEWNAQNPEMAQPDVCVEIVEPSTTPHVCSARQFSDQMVCERCNIRWDVNDTAPPPCFMVPSKVQNPEIVKEKEDAILSE